MATVTLTLTEEQTALYDEGGYPAWRIEESCIETLERAQSALWAGFGHLHPCFRGRLVVRLMYRCRV